MSFAAAAFLAGLAALVLPWWLHRLQTRSGQTRVVSSLLLMRPGEAPRQRRRSLRYRSLLALRLLLLAALAVAFAQPLLERTVTGAGSGPTVRPLIVVVDTSLSMAADFDRARSRAHQLVDGLPPGGRAAVVAAGAELRLLAGLTADRSALRGALATMAPGASRLAFDGLLGRVTALADTLTDAPVAIHLISDFQASAMPAQFNGLIAGRSDPVTLHDVGTASDNWQLAALALDEAVRVTVRSHAAVPRRLTVTLTSSAGEPLVQQLDVAAGGSATASFPLPAAGGQELWLRAAIDGGDRVALDDVLHRVMPRAESVALPVFAGPGARGQGDYLNAAVAAAVPRFVPGPADVQGPVAVLLDPGGLSGRELGLLERHLARGGAALMTGGPATQRAGRLPVIGAALDGGRGDTATGPGQDVVSVDSGHPLVARPASEVWDDVRVFRHLSLESEPGASVLLALDDGTPLLLEYRLAAGRVLLLTTALDPQWSSLVASPGFVGFVRRALAYLADDHLPSRALAGEPIALPAASLQVFDGAGTRLLALSETVSQPSLRLQTPGVYTLRTPTRQRLLAVNPDARESDPAPVSATLLGRWRDAAAAAGPLAADSDLAAAGTEPGAGNNDRAAAAADLALAPWLLALVLLLAVLEPVAANLGRPGAQA